MLRLMAGAALAVSMSLLATTAKADCRTAPFRFFVDQNDTVDTTVNTDGSECPIQFRAGGQLMLDGMTIAARPRNGTIATTGALSAVYRPKTGFKGKDAFAIRVCGSNRSGKGCSTIRYAVTVQ